jgi:hypothetical protein
MKAVAGRRSREWLCWFFVLSGAAGDDTLIVAAPLPAINPRPIDSSDNLRAVLLPLMSP